MGKNSGNTNYTKIEIDRLLDFVEQSLPLGRDEWERLAVTYNTGRARGTPERDFESLRRKFKVLYSTRKPTGVADMPPHIKRAKELKQAIDDKANVVEMDDEADRDHRALEPDFSFDPDPDDRFFEGGDSNGMRITTATTGAGLDDSIATDESFESEATILSRSSNRGEFQEMIATPLVIEPVGHTSRPTPLPAAQSLRLPSSGGLLEPSTAITNLVAGDISQAMGPPLTQGRSTGKSGANEASKYQNFSNRLGETDLTTFRGTVGGKRSLEEDKDILEASYAMAKRIRAMKTTTALKSKLNGLENSANSMGGRPFFSYVKKTNERQNSAVPKRSIAVGMRLLQEKPAFRLTRPRPRSVVGKKKWRWRSALAVIVRKRVFARRS